MDFYWEKRSYTFDPDSKYEQLVMSGGVKTGDSDKFRAFMLQNFEKYKSTRRRIRLASNGGNLVEALKMAAILRSIYADIDVESDKCASSCFFLYLSGVSRHTYDSTLIGIHRAFFEPAYFAKLNPDEAKAQQLALKKHLDSILDENQVPQYLKERMNSTSSADIYWLSDDDIKALGYMPAWYEELLIAKCDYGTFLKLDKKAWSASEDDPKRDSYREAMAESFWNYTTCEDKMIALQLSKIPPILTSNDSLKKPGEK